MVVLRGADSVEMLVDEKAALLADLKDSQLAVN
jgi:hypothetical protein